MAIQYTSISGTANLSVANPNLDGSGTIVNLITGSSYGTVIRSISIQALQNVNTGMIRIFTLDSSPGAIWNLLKEIPVRGVNCSADSPAYAVTIPFNNFIIPNGFTLGVTTQNAENFMVTAFGLEITTYY